MFHGLCRIFAFATVTACLTASFTSATSAAVTMLYVSTTGSNSNPCTLAQPCRSLQKAISKTPVGGEVHVLDSGFYGNNANIKKSITIVGNGHTVSLGVPIIVNQAGAIVTLRRLVLNGGGSTIRGIEILAATAVHIERCVVFAFLGQGVRLNTSNVQVFISNSAFRGNGGQGLMFFGNGSTKLTVDNSRFEKNGNVGLSVIDTETMVTRTGISGNGSDGVTVQGGRMNVTLSMSAHNNGRGLTLNSGAEVTLESSVARGNGNAGLDLADGIAVVSNSVLTNNKWGINNQPAGTVLTRENNTVTGNTTADVLGVLTPLGGT